MTIDEEALNEGWAAFYHSDKPAPFNCFRDGVEAYEQAKKPSVTMNIRDMTGKIHSFPIKEDSPANIALVKKLVEAMQSAKPVTIVQGDYTQRTNPNATTMCNSNCAWLVTEGERSAHKLKTIMSKFDEALTEANAYLERTNHDK